MGGRAHTQLELTRMTDDDVPAAAELDVDEGVSADAFRAELARPWARVWVARNVPVEDAHDPAVVAYVVTWIVVDELHVLNVATDRRRRREGIARALLRRVVGDAAQAGCRRVLLEVRRSNRAAVALYRGLGFFVTGVRPRYYADDEDAVEMALVCDAAGEPLPGADEVDAGV